MDRGYFDVSDISYYFRWSIALPSLLYLLFLPYILFYFFCRFCGLPHRPRQGLGYAVLAAGLRIFEDWIGLFGGAALILETALLAVCGMAVLKRDRRESWMTALLLRSVFGVIDGIVCWMDYQVFLPLVIRWEDLALFADTLRELGKVLLVIGFLTLILRHFYRNEEGILREQLLALIVPLFFIAFVERVLQEAFYSGAILVDTAAWTVSTEIKVSHGDNLALQLLAGACLPAVLLIYQRFVRVQHAEKRLLYLSSQEAEQRRYMEEAVLREKRTMAFRHDLKNHLSVLRELLRTGQEERACRYLDQLGEAAEGLSCGIRTGNAAVDVLLGSKCSVAGQKGIRVSCDLVVPQEGGLKEIDWCILISNAFDNAIRACEAAPPERRYLRLSGKRKGNLYLLLMENSCDENLKAPPPEGIGLSNIRAVLESASGTLEKTVSEGVYKLKLLFLLR